MNQRKMSVEELVDFAKKCENKATPAFNKIIGEKYRELILQQEKLEDLIYYDRLLPIEQAVNIPA